MKKILKSRIFIVIITLIIGVSGTLYATTKYQASEVIYNPSSGDSMTVNDALNELYNNKKGNSSLVEIANLGYVIGYSNSNPSYTYDIKELTSNYSELTEDNFLITATAGFCTTNYSTWADAGIDIYKSYNSTTGILTISAEYSSSQGGNRGGLKGVIIYMVN